MNDEHFAFAKAIMNLAFDGGTGPIGVYADFLFDNGFTSYGDFQEACNSLHDGTDIKFEIHTSHNGTLRKWQWTARWTMPSGPKVFNATWEEIYNDVRVTANWNASPNNQRGVIVPGIARQPLARPPVIPMTPDAGRVIPMAPNRPFPDKSKPAVPPRRTIWHGTQPPVDDEFGYWSEYAWEKKNGT